MTTWQMWPLRAYTLLWLLALVVQSIALPSIAQADGTFPPEEFNGLQITYTVAGAKLDAPKDTPGFTWVRTESGTLTGNTLTVSGSVKASMGYGASVRVSVSAGGEAKDFKADWSKSGGPDRWNQPFSVSVRVPPDAAGGTYSVSLVGDYNAGTRGVNVSGSLARDGAAASNPSTKTNSSTVPGIPIWVVAVGGGSVVAAAAAAAAAAVAIAIAKGAKAGDNSSQEEKSDKEPQTRYILQLSSDTLRVTPDTPASLAVSAWRTTDGSPPQPAPEAALRLVVPPSSGLQAIPDSGQGSLQASISAKDATATASVVLNVVGEAGGSQITATVTVQVDVQPYFLEVT